MSESMTHSRSVYTVLHIRDEANIGATYLTAYLLCKFLRERDPSVLVSDAIAKRWLQRHGGIHVKTLINSAGHLELLWGDQIRIHAAEGITAENMSQWMPGTHHVSVSARTCQTWMSKDWSTSGKLYLPESVGVLQILTSGVSLFLHYFTG